MINSFTKFLSGLFHNTDISFVHFLAYFMFHEKLKCQDILIVCFSIQTSHIYAPVILTFVRHCGGDVIGIISRKQR